MLQGCRVYKAYRPHAGLPGLRFLHPRWSGIWRALLRANADIYYTRAAGFVPGMLALLRRRRPLRYVYAAASDSDFTPDKVMIQFARDRWLFRYGLRRADAVIVQTAVQRDLLKTNYGRDAVLIPNFLDAAPIQLPAADRTQILWVGKIREIKRPLMFVDLARRLPELSFTMIGPNFEDEVALHQAVEAAAKTVPNLQVLGFQPLPEVEKHFDCARVLVSTSEMEGFPNVFLQAMRRGIPIVSFVDPDGIIRAKPGSRRHRRQCSRAGECGAPTGSTALVASGADTGVFLATLRPRFCGGPVPCAAGTVAGLNDDVLVSPLLCAAVQPADGRRRRLPKIYSSIPRAAQGARVPVSRLIPIVTGARCGSLSAAIDICRRAVPSIAVHCSL